MPADTRNPEPEYNYSRRPLSDEKKQKLLAMLTNGSSRRKAALCVGCSPSTIARYIRRDPEFFEQVVNAERFLEIHALRAIRTAGQNPRYWRANAWLLERVFPEEFGKRPPLSLTTEHLRRLFSSLFAGMEQAVPEGKWDVVMDKFDEYCDETEEDHYSIQPPPLPTGRLFTPRKPPETPSLSNLPVGHPTDNLDEVTDSDDDATDYEERTSDERP